MTASTALRCVTILIATIALLAAVIVGWLGQRLRTFALAAERQAIDLERALKSRERLVRGITHDLKNPLHAIAGHAELLREGIRGPLNPRQAESIERISRCVADELMLLTDLLDASQAEAGMLHVTFRATNLSRLLEDLAAEYRPAALAAGHVLEVRVSPEAESVETDSHRVKQILSNLVSNAIKYSFPGPITLTAARLERDGADTRGWTAVEVADSGPGIPDDELEKIFDEFYRISSNASKPGSGLGLAIARRVAALLGAKLTVRSSGGAVFTLWIPSSRTPFAGNET